MCSTRNVDNWSDLGPDEGLSCAITIKCKVQPTIIADAQLPMFPA